MVRGGGVRDFQVAAFLERESAHWDFRFLFRGFCGFRGVVFHFSLVVGGKHVNLGGEKNAS